VTSTEAYAALLAHLRESAALGQIARLLVWDQEAMMPPKGAAQRAEQAAALEAVRHARRTDPRIADWLAAIDPGTLDAAGRANMHWTRRGHERAVRVPAALAAEIARETTLAHGVWAEARRARRFADFAPALARVVALVRRRAECLRRDGETLYDALLDDYEPGATEAGLAAMFGRLRPRLTALRERIAGSGQDVPRLSGSFPAAAQLALAREVATVLGYDWQAGRLDLVVHPFVAGTLGDVRITARIDEADPFCCLSAVAHETGHAIYEQGLDPALAWQPAGASVSMGVHESQSRLIENQVGRSAAFAEWLYPRMTAAFGAIGVCSPEALHRAANRVEPGFIRTEADEVHYNLHIMLRFDLERALLAGDLPVGDLEAAWDDRFAADFGRAVPDAGRGVLQDVHWSEGLVGYFPTYTLGNVYAGALWAALRGDLPDIAASIRAGEPGRVLDWLRSRVHRQGSLHPPAEIVARACGEAPGEAPLLDYLDEKYTALYRL
jgi:carboxypeptidase Taq